MMFGCELDSSGIRDTQIHFVVGMQSFWILKQVVYIVTNDQWQWQFFSKKIRCLQLTVKKMFTSLTDHITGYRLATPVLHRKARDCGAGNPSLNGQERLEILLPFRLSSSSSCSVYLAYQQATRWLTSPDSTGTVSQPDISLIWI
jgi:hypothetical protein